jgi:hypothetical protein
MLLFKLNTSNVVTIMLAAGGTPVTGLTATDVDCFLSKNGSSPVAYTLDGTNFTELSATDMPGLYTVDFAASSIDTEGEWIAVFKDSAGGGAFDQYASRAIVYANLFDDVNARVGTAETNINSQITTTETNLTAEIDENEGKIDVVNANIGGFNGAIDDIKGSGFSSGTDSLKAQRDLFDSRVPSEVAQKDQLVGTGGTEAAPAGIGLWDVLGDGSVSIGDIDLSLQRLLGLGHENFAIRDQVYDTKNNLLNATVKIYPSKADVQGDTNAIGTYSISATYDSQNRLTDYQMVKDS